MPRKHSLLVFHFYTSNLTNTSFSQFSRSISMELFSTKSFLLDLYAPTIDPKLGWNLFSNGVGPHDLSFRDSPIRASVFDGRTETVIYLKKLGSDLSKRSSSSHSINICLVKITHPPPFVNIGGKSIFTIIYRDHDIACIERSR